MADKPTVYPHRRNRDGLYDSICPACFATIARSQPEAEMAELEKSHLCNSSFLAERGESSRTNSARHPVSGADRLAGTWLRSS